MLLPEDCDAPVRSSHMLPEGIIDCIARKFRLLRRPYMNHLNWRLLVDFSVQLAETGNS